MASYPHRHHQSNHPTTTIPAISCCCQPPSHHPPSPLTTDPFLLSAIVSELLYPHNQNPTPQNPPHFYPSYSNPTSINPNHTYPHPQPHQFHPHSALASLFERIQSLEDSLNRFSSLHFCSRRCFSVKDAAARTIQTHFRAYLVRRSRTLGQLKQLACIKSCVNSLQSSLSRCGFVDFDSLSRKALDFKLQLESIQGDDKMIRDSKRSIAKDTVQLLDMVDLCCVKKHHHSYRTIRNNKLVRNDDRTAPGGRGLSERGMGSKCRSMNGEESNLIRNLREKVERISMMSKVLEVEEVNDDGLEGSEHVGAQFGQITNQIADNYQLDNWLSIENNANRSNAKHGGRSVEEGSVVWVNNVEGLTTWETNAIKDFNNRRQDEEETLNAGERPLLSSGSHHGEDTEFTFSIPAPLKMEPRAGLMRRKPGVKIVG